jgi:hypothetical protein
MNVMQNAECTIQEAPSCIRPLHSAFDILHFRTK